MVLTEKTFPTNTIDINYCEGPTSGPPLVLLHGMTLQWQSFRPLLSALTQDWKVYACDLRGHGKSSRASSYHMDDYVHDTIQFINHRVTEPAVVAAHSLGGIIALCVAAREQQQIRALVLFDPAFTIGMGQEMNNTSLAWCQWVYATVTAARSYDDVVEACRAKRPDAGEAMIEELAKMVHCVDALVLDTWSQKGIMVGVDLGKILSQVMCPTMIFRAGLPNTSVMRDSDVALVRRHLPNIEFIDVANGGHLLHKQQPEVVIQHMRAFLQAL